MGGRLLDVHARNRDLIREEISRLVAEAADSGSVLQTGVLAERIAGDHGQSGLEPQQIADEIARAGSRAGVAVEISRPRGRTGPRRSDGTMAA